MTINAALLHPGNRLLNGGTTDFAMFGAQPSTVTIARPEPTGSGYVTAFGGQDAHPASAGPDPGQAAPGALYTGTIGLDAPIDNGQDVFTSGLHPFAIGGGASPTIAPLVPSPTGSGSLAQSAPQLSSPSFDTSAPGAAATPIDPAHPLQAPVLDIAASPIATDGFALAHGLATTSLAQAVTLADAALPALAGTITATLNAATNTSSIVLDGLATHVGAVEDGLDGAIDVAQGEVADLAGTTLAATSAVADIASTTVDHATGTAEAVIGAAQDSVAATVMPLVDHLAATDAGGADATDVLAGTDPAAGIATLTAMVGSADVFELPRDAIGGTVDTVASALDAVPDDGAAAALLGDAAHDLSTHDAAHDDAHLGIGGL